MRVTLVGRRLRLEDSVFKNSLGFRETLFVCFFNSSCLILLHMGGSAFSTTK